MTRIALIGVLVAAFFATTAQAGRDANLCRLPNAQSGSGQLFSSRQECARAAEVFAPSLSSTPSSFGAQEVFVLNVTGLHPNAYMVVYFAITGQPAYGSYTPFYPTDASGNFSIPFVFEQCGNSPDNLTITIADSFGVHASTQVTLC